MNILSAVILALAIFASPLVQAKKAQYVLSAVEFKAIDTAQSALGEGQLELAQQALQGLLDNPALKPYPKALSLQLLANIALSREHPKTALKHFRNAYQLEALPPEQQRQVLRVVAQLHMQLEQWKSAIARLNSYIKRTRREAPKSLEAEDYVMLAQANAQLERWKAVIPPIRQAIKMRRAPPESWLRLQLAAHALLSQHKSVIALVEKKILPRFADERDYWLQLAGAYQALERWPQTLSTLRAAHLRGHLQSEEEIRWLVQLLLQQDAPIRAIEVLQHAFEQQQLKQNAEHLKLWADASMMARDYPSAEQALTRLSQQKPTAEYITRLAEVQLQQKDWQSAEKTLVRALKIPEADQPRLQLMRGTNAVQQGNYALAREVFEALSEHEQYRPSAQQWLDYIELMAPAQPADATAKTVASSQ